MTTEPPPPCRPFPCAPPQNLKVTYVVCEKWEDEVLCDMVDLLSAKLTSALASSDMLVGTYRDRPPGAFDHISGACNRYAPAEAGGCHVDETNQRFNPPPTWATAPMWLDAQPFVVVVPGEESMKRCVHAVRSCSIQPSEKLCSLHIEAVSADDTEEFVSWVRTSDARPHVVFMTDLAVRRWGVSSDVASFVYVMSMTYPRGRALSALLAQYFSRVVHASSHTHSHLCTAPPPMEGGSDVARAVDLIPECIGRVQASTVRYESTRFWKPAPTCFGIADLSTARALISDLEEMGHTAKELPLQFADDAW